MGLGLAATNAAKKKKSGRMEKHVEASAYYGLGMLLLTASEKDDDVEEGDKDAEKEATEHLARAAKLVPDNPMYQKSLEVMTEDETKEES